MEFPASAPGRAGEVQPVGCADPFMGAGFDLEPLSSEAVRTVVSILLQDEDSYFALPWQVAVLSLREQGGLLIGYRGPDETAVVTRIVGPGPGAICRTDSFEPDYDYQEAAVERIYAESQGAERYLGDWHTHPDGGLYLSWKDLVVLRQIADYADTATATGSA